MNMVRRREDLERERELGTHIDIVSYDKILTLM